MSLITLDTPIYWPTVLGFGVTGGSYYLSTPFDRQINNADRKVAFVFRVPRSGNITHIGWRMGAAITTDEQTDARLETVGADGRPTGTLAGTNTNKTRATHAAARWYWEALTASYAASAGEVLAIVIKIDSYSAGNFYVATGLKSDILIGQLYPYNVNYIGAWTNDDVVPMCGIKIDSVVCPLPGCYAMGSGQDSSPPVFASASTPDEVGARFQIDVPCKTIGAWVRLNQSSSADSDYELRLYDDAGTLLAKATRNDTTHLGNNWSLHFFVWDSAYSEVTLAKDTTYRLTVRATDASNVAIEIVTVEAAEDMAIWPPGAQFYKTSCTDGGAFTDDTTKRPFSMGLIVSALDDGTGGAGGGLLVHPGMAGGIRG